MKQFASKRSAIRLCTTELISLSFSLLVVLVIANRASAQSSSDNQKLIVLTFNILQGGAEAKNVGFDNSDFGGSRIDEIAAVIKQCDAQIVGIQEDCASDALLKELGDSWNRVGNVYSKFELTKVSVQPYLTVAKAKLDAKLSLTIVNCHWFPPRGGYGPDVVQSELKKNPDIDHKKLAEIAIKKCAVPDGPRGYKATIDPLKTALENNETVLLMGDFNEPSHLDWTEHYAKHGPDPWVKNPTGVTTRCAIPWPGSTKLEKLGLTDSYRDIHKDEAKIPGFTWTPKYPDNTPGRRIYGDQCLDRIDRIYHHGKIMRAIEARVVGEGSRFSDLVFKGKWPSDHRAVLVRFVVE